MSFLSEVRRLLSQLWVTVFVFFLPFSAWMCDGKVVARSPGLLGVQVSAAFERVNAWWRMRQKGLARDSQEVELSGGT